ncbi:MAG: TonB-dependent receptor plug domain-containing protein [Muribaculaceae bacterium]
MKIILYLAMALPTMAFAASPTADEGPFAVDSLELDSLMSDSYDLNEVVITGTRVPHLLKETPVQTRLITLKDIIRTDATNVQDLLQQELPGIEFSYAMNQQTHLNFNGQGGQSVLFLVDGERMAGETMDDVDFSRLDMSNVERIEIVRGAASALYGSNAGGGVINIITRHASRPWTLSGSARIARHNEQRYTLSATARGSVVENVLSASHNSIDSYDVHSAPNPVTRVVSTIYGNSLWNVSDRFTVKPAREFSLTARAGYFFRQLNRTDDSPERYRDFSGGLRGEWAPAKDHRLELSYAFDQYDKSTFYKLSRLDVRNYSNVQNSVRGLYNWWTGETGSLTAGADFMRDFMRNDKLKESTRSQISADAFVQYDWNISRQVELVGALRYDYFSDGRMSRVTPKISARWTLPWRTVLRAGYGMGFRAPTLKEKYYQFDMAGIWIVNGNPNLKPESSHNFSLSAEYTRGHYNVTASVSYNDIRNRISTGLPYYRPDGDKQLYLDYVNLASFSLVGAELAVQGRWNNGLSARINYAYTGEHVGRDKDGNTANNPYIPARKHTLTARADWEKDFSKKYSLTLSVNGRFLSGVDNVEYKDYYDISAGTVTVSYPAYTLWKLSVSQLFLGKIKLTLALDNIFNYKPRYYYLNCPLTDGINFQAGLSFDIP